jgi:aspartate/tyrosine/aromatic aminotransferase
MGSAGLTLEFYPYYDAETHRLETGRMVVESPTAKSDRVAGIIT